MSTTMAKILHEHGYVSVLADAYSIDPAIDDPHFHVDFVGKLTQPGSVLVMHAPERNHRRQTLQVLRDLIPKLRSKGFKFIRLDELHSKAISKRENKIAAKVATDSAAARNKAKRHR
mmetsp:Transcript_9330/g.18193  ORF Transcript_9330/g.18193 Transcript_9330/m.18193 type:complete len:117 (+) Transcript_9330:337-687(+)